VTDVDKLSRSLQPLTKPDQGGPVPSQPTSIEIKKQGNRAMDRG
jgi:hypothetical protein